MKTASGIFKGCTWAAFAYSLLIQLLVLISLGLSNASLKDSASAKPYSLLPLTLATILLLAGFCLFLFLKKHRWIGLLVTVAACVLFVIIALDLARAFPTQISSTGATIGISTRKLITRHFSPILVAIFMLPAWLCGRAAAKQASIALTDEDKPHYDLGGDRLFCDDEDDALANDETRHPAKRSVRQRLKKEK